MAAITSTDTANMDVSHPAIEVARLLAVDDSDYYDAVKLRNVYAAFVSQDDTDSEEIKVALSRDSSRYCVSYFNR